MTARTEGLRSGIILTSLAIRNYALIEDVRLDLLPGLNVLTGETGAGKSIIVGALSLILGERSDPDMIRAGNTWASVEATFEGPDSIALSDILAPAFEAVGVIPEWPLILRRRLVRAGRGQTFVNDQGVTSETFKRIGDLLIDLHGQHEHQSLLDPASQLAALDDFAGLTGERQRLAHAFSAYRADRNELAHLEAELVRRRQQRELTEQQLHELQNALSNLPSIDSLIAERNLLETQEKRLELLKRISDLVSEGESALQGTATRALRQLEALVQLDPRLMPTLEELRAAAASIDDVSRELWRYRDSIEDSPGRLDEINALLFRLETLVRKYLPLARGIGPESIQALAELQDRLSSELAKLDTDETNAKTIAERVRSRHDELVRMAEDLSLARHRAAPKFQRQMATALAQLGLPHAQLLVQIRLRPDPEGCYTRDGHTYRLDETGVDDLEFLFTANPGEEPRPLRKIISGGELSRVMLALKEILQAKTYVPVMVFDEIDTGIGGRVAERVGRSLARIATSHQVICVTHLPQIARFAQAHFRVTKETRQGRTTTKIDRLSEADRVTELARMLAGSKVSNAALVHARELLEHTRS